MGMVKSGCGQSCDRSLKLTVSEEWTGGINWFFVRSYRFLKIKSWSKFLGGMVKNGCGQSGHETLDTGQMDCILKTNRWMKWFFTCWYKFMKLKVDSRIFGWRGQKWPWPFSSRDPKICCIIRMNDFLNADSDGNNFLFDWYATLNTESPLQLYLFFFLNLFYNDRFYRLFLVLSKSHI